MERRAFTRADCAIEAALAWSGETFPARIVNISLGGAMIDTAASPTRGECVEVRFSHDIDGRELAVHCLARVVRADTRGLGVQFAETDYASLRDLRDIVLAHGADPLAVRDEFDRLARRPADATR